MSNHNLIIKIEAEEYIYWEFIEPSYTEELSSFQRGE